MSDHTPLAFIGGVWLARQKLHLKAGRMWSKSDRSSTGRSERERGREREREREGERETDRQTDRDSERDRQTDRQTETASETDRDRERDRHRQRQTETGPRERRACLSRGGPIAERYRATTPNRSAERIQGYLAHKKTPPPRTLQ